MDSSRFKLPERLQGFEENVWIDFIELAQKYKPVKLDLGYPDFAPPEHFTKALADVTCDPDVGIHQYTRSFGHPRLVSALSKLYSPLVGRDINAQTEIIVQTGAHQALFSAILGHISPGDEVIIIEPFFDSYEPIVKAAGGIAKFIALKQIKTTGELSSGDWVLDKEELASVFNAKTKMIIINTPHNPLGKVLTRSELENIAELCVKYNALCLTDEVYEFIIYKPHQHVRIASLPGMWERTITVGSAGKAFSLTGWKIGWAYGAANLIFNLQILHQNSIYTCTTPLQEALARGIEYELTVINTHESYFNKLVKRLEPKREQLVQALRQAGLNPVIPEGGYFILADWSPIAKKINLSEEKGDFRDFKFAKWITKNIGLQGIPPSAFYSHENKALGEDFIRFCFIKKDETLDKAVDILKNWKTS